MVDLTYIRVARALSQRHGRAAALLRRALALATMAFWDITLELADRPEPDLTWITPDLAVGGKIRVDEWGAVAAGGIRAVVDCRAEACDPADLLARHGIAFLHLPTPDANAFAPGQVSRGVTWIERHRCEGAATLIHCRAGKGRSVTLCAAVLTHQGIPPAEALTLIRSHRPIITPTPGQIAQLYTYAAADRGRE